MGFFIPQLPASDNDSIGERMYSHRVTRVKSNLGTLPKSLNRTPRYSQVIPMATRINENLNH
jgi:hypothetical protein